MSEGSFTDIRRGGWLDHLPAAWRPYGRLARLDRPIGWWLLLLPCWWSLALAGGGRPDVVLFGLFWVGAVVMRGAGCTLNDILDRKIDAAVERTRSRPIPSGEVSVPAAILFMAGQAAVGAVVLVLLKPVAIGLGLAVLVLVATYPLMKRVTDWPQLFLGLNFNWGALVGWAAATGRVGAPAVALYLGGVLWTLGYDTIYAHQDKEDDQRVGVRSTALRLGAASRGWVGSFYAGAIGCWALAFWLAGVTPTAAPLAWATLPLIAGHALWQVWFWRIDDQADCLKRFKSNRDLGIILLAGCLLAALGR